MSQGQNCRKISCCGTLRLSEHTRGRVVAKYLLLHFRVCVCVCVYLMWFCPCHTPPLHVPATCPLCVNTWFCRCNMLLRHVPASWPLVCGELYVRFVVVVLVFVRANVVFFSDNNHDSLFHPCNAWRRLHLWMRMFAFLTIALFVYHFSVQINSK